MAQKVMQLLDVNTGHMQCKVCGAEHVADLKGGGLNQRASWQCQHGCQLPDTQ